MPRHVQNPSGPAALAALWALSAGFPAMADGDPKLRDADTPIDQITVVAHKDERSIRDVAAHVTTVSGAELRNELATSASDLFRYVPGIDHESGGLRFGTEGFNIRGIGGNRVAILIDGVPLSDQFDVGSFSNATRDFIDAGLISNIEVLHGPASALYGSAALGGVIAVQTPHPAGPGDGDAQLAWSGKDSSLHGQATMTFGGQALGVLLGASWRDGEEADAAAADTALDHRAYSRRTALVKMAAEDRSGGTWQGLIVSQGGTTRTDIQSLLGTGRYRSTTALQGDDSSQLDLASLSYAFQAGGRIFDRGIVRAYYRHSAIEQFTLDERADASTPVSIDRYFSFEQDSQGIELNLRRTIEGDLGTHRAGVGVEYREHQTREYRDGLQTTLTTGAQTGTLLGEAFPLRDFPISRTIETGAFIEDSWSLGDWVVIAALRVDCYSLEPRIDAMYAQNYPFGHPVSLAESDVSPKFGVIYQASANIDVYAQYSHGFRAPPYSDANIALDIPLFNIRAIPNPDLRSESSDGIELGLRLVADDVNVRLAAFHTRYGDFIETKVRVGTDPQTGRILFQSRNLREATISGIEAALRWRFGGDRRPLSLDLAAFYAVGENRENGEALNSVGPPQAIVALAWHAASERQRLQLTATLTDDWSSRDESGGELFKPPGVAVFDAYFFRQLGDNTALRLGLQNITDRSYWSWTDVRGLSPGEPMLPYLSRPGRSVSLSINFNW